jgi:6-pyruvoyltetrahydropterin/6-carboxytetrahydropterin synthase
MEFADFQKHRFFMYGDKPYTAVQTEYGVRSGVLMQKVRVHPVVKVGGPPLDWSKDLSFLLPPEDWKLCIPLDDDLNPIAAKQKEKQMISITRYHDISCGHRVVGHESKCRFLHGHNYRIHFTCTAEKLDDLGRVIDFGVVKSALCMWLEDNWDHKMLLWDRDPLLSLLDEIKMPMQVSPEQPSPRHEAAQNLAGSIVEVPFNPTAENLGDYLLETIGPARLAGTGVRLIKVRIEETRKCSAVAEF